jgi:hypothetical protein
MKPTVKINKMVARKTSARYASKWVAAAVSAKRVI